MLFVKDALIHNDKWFFAGIGYIYSDKKRKEEEPESVYYMKVFDNNGKHLKTLLHETIINQSLSNFMKYHIDVYKNLLYFMKENQLVLHVISIDELKKLNTVNLETPNFYKKMPKGFYNFKPEYRGRYELLKRDRERWEIEYSQVTKMFVDGNRLIVQVRTCSDQLKKFALLVYNAASLELEKTIFIDDFLVATKNGKYYFIEGGNPSRDDDIDDCIINIYRFKEKK